MFIRKFNLIFFTAWLVRYVPLSVRKVALHHNCYGHELGIISRAAIHRSEYDGHLDSRVLNLAIGNNIGSSLSSLLECAFTQLTYFI